MLGELTALQHFKPTAYPMLTVYAWRESQVARLFDNHQSEMSFSSALYLVSPWHFGRHRKKLRGSTVEWEIQVWCGRTSLERHLY